MRHMVFVFLVLAAQLAAAQPAPPPTPPPAGGEGGAAIDTPPPPTPTPSSPPANPPPARPAPPPRPMAAEHDPSAVPPDEVAIGIGFGWLFPDNIETPNTVSALIRFTSGVTLEPRVVARSTSTTMDPGVMGVPSTTDKTTDLVLAAIIRVPVVKHGRIELELLGTAGIEQHKLNPDGPDNDTTSNSLFLGWGVGIGYWLSRHWELATSAENPFLTRTSTSKDIGMGMQSTETTTTFGLVFDPTVTFMIRLYH
jgi:hypothetical protein